MQLSILDIGWPGHVPTLVPAVERFGYRRYWATEHHSPHQSASPLVVAGIAAQASERIRVGTAGVLLSIHPPARVVSDASVLELLYPGRIDLGIASAVGAVAELTDALCDGSRTHEYDAYWERARELVRLTRRATWRDYGDGLESGLGPIAPTKPALWACGTSERSAIEAARLGMSFAFHDWLRAPDVDGAAVVARYREEFRPSPYLDRPEVVVATLGHCNDDHRAVSEARRDARAVRRGYWGDRTSCADQLHELADRHGVDELAVYDTVGRLDVALDAYGMLAEALGLGAAAPSLADGVARSGPDATDSMRSTLGIDAGAASRSSA